MSSVFTTSEMTNLTTRERIGALGTKLAPYMGNNVNVNLNVLIYGWAMEQRTGSIELMKAEHRLSGVVLAEQQVLSLIREEAKTDPVIQAELGGLEVPKGAFFVL